MGECDNICFAMYPENFVHTHGQNRTLTNQVPKIILRDMAVTVGNAYFLSTFYLALNMPDLTSVNVVIGRYGTALGQMLIGLILVGIGLGVVSIRFGKES